jgi:hypothetical protein
VNADLVWDVEGPVQAEIFVVWLDRGAIQLTGPCGPAPWYVEIHAADHPVETVDRLLRDALGPPRVVHSTSWRRDRGSVILSFIVVIDPERVGTLESLPIGRTELARSAATAAPSSISEHQVLEHGLRHLAWLVQDDPVVAGELSEAWRKVLQTYVPEPFRALG